MIMTGKKLEIKAMKYNLNIQDYKGIKFRLIKRKYESYNAKRYLLINSENYDPKHPSQNFWIPDIYLEEDGTVKPNANIDFVFVKAMFTRKLRYAGIKVPAWLYQRANGY